MKWFSFVFAILLTSFSSCQFDAGDPPPPRFVLLIHGGAGTILRENMTADMEKQYLDKLNEALQSGAEILRNNGSSLDAVAHVITIMEDSPLFNAGKGAVFTAEGVNEMDASIMEGANLNAGAVTGIRHIKNPILAAKAVMEKSPHVMLFGQGAEEFAIRQQLTMVDSSYFFTDSRWKSFQRAKEKADQNTDDKFGTVGAVALDLEGNLAAGTSTGGMTYKLKGRVGDSPIIGAGTYADNSSCAVSATGHGEYFMRNVVGHEIASLVKYAGVGVKEAANFVISKKLKDMGGDGGVIALEANGNFTMTFNTRGMYRGYITSDGKTGVLIYDDEQ